MPAGIELVLQILTKIIELVGPAVVQGHLDEYVAARAAADTLEDIKFGPKP